MANANTPFGLQVLRAGGAYDFNAQGNLYVVTSGDTNAMYLNDAMVVAAGGDGNGVPAITKNTSGTGLLRGSLQAIFPVYAGTSIAGTALSLETTNIPATKAANYYVLVDDDPTTVYMVQDDGVTTGNLVAASCNLNSSLTITAGASTTSPSGTVLLSSSFATTQTLCMKLFGLVQGQSGGAGAGNAYGAYAKWQARINTSDMAPGVGATGA